MIKPISEFVELYSDHLIDKRIFLFLAYGCCVHCGLKITHFKVTTKHPHDQKLKAKRRGKRKYFTFYSSTHIDMILMNIDHIIPVIGGGSDRMSNLQVLCQPCNLKKGSRSESEFYDNRVVDIPPEAFEQSYNKRYQKHKTDIIPEWQPIYGL